MVVHRQQKQHSLIYIVDLKMVKNLALIWPLFCFLEDSRRSNVNKNSLNWRFVLSPNTIYQEIIQNTWIKLKKQFLKFLGQFWTISSQLFAPRDLKMVKNQCKWSQMKVFDVLFQFCLKSCFTKQQTESTDVWDWI